MQAILPEDLNQFDTLNLDYIRVESIIIVPVPCLKTVHVIVSYIIGYITMVAVRHINLDTNLIADIT